MIIEDENEFIDEELARGQSIAAKIAAAEELRKNQNDSSSMSEAINEEMNRTYLQGLRSGR